MNSSDLKRSHQLGGQLGTIVYNNKDLITHTSSVIDATSIGCKLVLINQSLATLLHHLQICNKQDVQDHVALKDNEARRLTKRCMDAGAACVRCILQRNIHKMFDSVNAGQRSQRT